MAGAVAMLGAVAGVRLTATCVQQPAGSDHVVIIRQLAWQ